MKRTGLAFSWIGFLVLAACQGSSVPAELQSTLDGASGIVGGTTVRETADPAAWSVAALELEISVSSLQGSTKEASFCTGTLIAKDVVLTAAHCLLPSKKTPFASVNVSGSAVFSRTGERYAVKRALGHRDYDENVAKDSAGITHANPSADIAVLLLEREVSEPLRPTLLPEAHLREGVSVPTRIYGYGSENYGNHFFSTQASGNPENENEPKMPLRWVDATGFVADARLRYDQSGGKGFCKGDSGGPHFVYENGRPVVIAVSSSVTDVSIETPDWCRRGSVAILVAPFLPWLRQSLADLRASD